MLLFPIVQLVAWFEEEKRQLPWRENPTPYAVWISEVMLQQTQVAVVLPYFQRWMERFPSIEDLSRASLEEVLKLWEGLGYYSRARSLHQAARLLIESHGGKLPSSREALQQIPGLGPYTIGAILSFAFRQKAAAVDGNVLRVLSRFFAIEEDISTEKTRSKLRILTEELLPDDAPWIAMEALIELGAKVCQKTPRCSICPLQDECLAFREGKEKILPVKGKKREYLSLIRHVGVIADEKEVLLRRGEKGKVMADLYEFPYLEQGRKRLSQALIKKEFERELGLELTFTKKLPMQKHTFTHHRVQLLPTLWEPAQKVNVPGCVWVAWDEIESLPFSSGHRRILRGLS